MMIWKAIDLHASPGLNAVLFQSVHGHPLLRILTKEIITKELYDFVRQHLQTRSQK